MLSCAYLAELFSFSVWQELFERSKASIDTLHATPLIAVSYLPTEALFVLHGAPAHGRGRPSSAAHPATTTTVTLTRRPHTNISVPKI